MEFERLITELTLDSIIVSEIEDLLVKKKAGVELDVGPEIAVLNEFLEGQIAYYQEYVKGIEKGTGIGVEKLDVLFRDMLFEIEKEHR